jgi:hypothetical protein
LTASDDLWPHLRNQSLAAEASDSDIQATSCHLPVARQRSVSHVKVVKRIRLSCRIRIIFQVVGLEMPETEIPIVA